MGFFDWFGGSGGDSSWLPDVSSWFGGETETPKYNYLNDTIPVDNTLDIGGGATPLPSPQGVDYSSLFASSPLTNFSSFMPSGDSGGSSSWAGSWKGLTDNPISNTIAEYPKLSLALAGAGLQGISDISATNEAKKKREAAAAGATNYQNALQSGKTEAISQFLQTAAAQRGALAEKMGRYTSDSGGANTRKTMEKFNRQSNEDYGKFLLNLAQSKTPDMSSYMAQAEGNIASEPWWSGFAKGGASTAGSVLGSLTTSDLLNSLFKRNTG